MTRTNSFKTLSMLRHRSARWGVKNDASVENADVNEVQWRIVIGNDVTPLEAGVRRASTRRRDGACLARLQSVRITACWF